MPRPISTARSLAVGRRQSKICLDPSLAKEAADADAQRRGDADHGSVDEAGVQQFILERCAVPYFSNLIWFVREECNQLDREFATASTKAKSG